MRAAVGVCIVLGALAGSAQEPLRVSTEVVPVYATVRGDDGHLLTELQQSDFVVLDRGQRVPVALFSNEPQPITVAVMVDMTGHFGADWQSELKRGLLAFIDELDPGDRARIGTFQGNEIALGFHLTADHSELKRVVREEIWWGSTGRRPLWNAIATGMQSLAGEPGRRVVLVLANGPEDDANLPDVPGRKYIETAMEEGSFMVYVVSLFEGNRVDRRRPNDAVTNPSRLSLTEVVETTGGGYFRAFPGGRAQYLKEATDGYLVQRLSAVVEELRSQYALGFVPRHRDGKVGKIEVRVNRPGVTVSARKSYRAPGNTP